MNISKYLNEIKDLDLNDLKIAVDFDGTLTKGDYYPVFGDVQKEAFEFLKFIQKRGAKIYLDTMRFGQDLKNAIKYCRKQDLIFDSIGPSDEQYDWTTSNKCYAHYSIDDRNIGTPLKYDENNKPYVYWEKVIKILIERIKLEHNDK